FLFFFFQAEDGIRDFHVTGVQTCALPIWQRRPREYLLADLVFQLGSLHLALGPAAVVAAVAMVLAVGRPIAAALPLVALLALYAALVLLTSQVLVILRIRFPKAPVRALTGLVFILSILPAI